MVATTLLTMLFGASALVASQTTHVVTVSNSEGDLRYFPDNISAQPGDIVAFEFYPKNHTVTEASFAQPCHPITSGLSATHPGIKSGFMPVSDDDPTAHVFQVKINDTNPIWLYCGQTGHCQKGMVAVINQAPNQTAKTIDTFRAAAEALANGTSSSSSSSSAAASSSTSTSSGYASSSTSASTTMSSSSTTSASASSSSSTGKSAANQYQPLAYAAQAAGVIAIGVAAML